MDTDKIKAIESSMAGAWQEEGEVVQYDGDILDDMAALVAELKIKNEEVSKLIARVKELAIPLNAPHTEALRLLCENIQLKNAMTAQIVEYESRGQIFYAGLGAPSSIRLAYDLLGKKKPQDLAAISPWKKTEDVLPDIGIVVLTCNPGDRYTSKMSRCIDAQGEEYWQDFNSSHSCFKPKLWAFGLEAPEL